jgi:predicted secreted protein
MMKRLFLLSVIVVFSSLISFGQETGDFNLVGFSKDGKYLAFERFGYSDPKCSAFSGITFVNAWKNTIALKSVDFDLDNDDCTKVELARKKAKEKAETT